MKGLRTIALGSAALVASALVTTTAGSARATTGDGGACDGVRRCKVVDVADVDGDRRADEIGWVARPARGKVVIRVATADGDLLRKRFDVSLWFGTGAWGGAAAIDGRRGAEILVGTVMGAHTPSYTMLTVRHGDLVRENSPAQGDRWYVDAAYSVYVGWARTVRADGTVVMTYRQALRSRDDSFDGFRARYRWEGGQWVAGARRDRHWDNARQASSIAGWQVRGLERFPGV